MLITIVRRQLSTPLLRLITLLLCFSLATSASPLTPMAILALTTGGVAATPIQEPQERKAVLATHTKPGSLLPDLDTERRKEHKKPEKLPDQPPTKCGYRDQECQRKKVGIYESPQATELRSLLADNSSARRTLETYVWNNTTTTDAVIGNSNTRAAVSPVVPVQSGLSPSDILAARIDPRNRVGQPGVDLLSGNYHWSVPLVSVAGRAGLDFGLGLSYNSLVWLKVNPTTTPTMLFDPDYGNPSPGWRLGLPEVQGSYSDNESGRNAYLLIMPSGQRIILRQVGTTSVYESGDSSYLQLNVDSTSQLTLRVPGGTTLTLTSMTNPTPAYRCTQIKDANGNYISATYTTNGRLSTVTDTLGRVFNFSYFADNFHIQQITQSWNGTTHAWATFYYSTLTYGTNFGSMAVSGPANGASYSVLSTVVLNDGGIRRFYYNGYGLMNACYRHGADNTQLAVKSIVDGSGGVMSDAPRMFSASDWAFDWNAGWVITAGYDINPDRVNGSNERWGSFTAADGTVTKEYFASSGWQHGLTLRVENWAGSVKKKWTTATYTQDNTSVSYQTNPRVTETNIYDDANGDGVADNRSRTTINYRQVTLPNGTLFTAPQDVTDYKADATTVLRTSHTDYLEDTNYLSAHLLGLPRFSYLYDGTTSGTLMAKSEIIYDNRSRIVALSPAAVQMDSSYNNPNSYYRGLVTSTRRYNVNDNSYLESTITYNTAGAVTATADPLGHTSQISYTDSFSDNVNRNTYAYPTTVTDADNYSSTMKYDFSHGGVTKTTNPKGAAVNTTYDWAGRVSQVTNAVNGAYTRYVYSNSHNEIQSFTTVNDLSTETYAVTIYDGHGRTRANVTEHPGSEGGYSSVYNVYDNLGRLSQVSNPTEINTGWYPKGDDKDTGYIWSQQAYDWKGRPTVTTNQDGTTRQIQYEGCGCAGGLVTTTIDEMGRKQKAYRDVLGRVTKTEILNADNSVYSATTTTLNVRDQVTNLTEYAGAVGSGGASQQTLLTYDGYGRLLTRKRPQESAATTYSYYANDWLLSSTDARGATGTLTYNARGLMTQATYTVPAGVAETPTVTFQYDSTGQRTEMDDGPGKVTYERDTLSRITKETRTFDSLPGQSFQLQYEYNLSGQVTKLTDPMNDSINYAYDKTGRLTAVTGSSFGGVTEYATGITYRAWNVTKAAAYGSGFAASIKYTPRLQVKEFDIPGVIGGTYSYNLDGQLASFSPSTPQSSDYDWRMSRSFSYDAIGRMNGSQAAGGSSLFPYAYNPTYDEFNNITSSSYLYWQSGNTAVTFNATYQNNRAGTVTDAGQAQTWNYDAMGNRTAIVRNGTTIESIQVDAVGRARNGPLDGEGQPITPQSYSGYYVRSSVFGGQIITELNYAGAKNSGRVLAEGQILAEQFVGASGNFVRWHHRDPLNLVARDTEPGQIKRKTFAINPVGAQIETTDGVNISQYYACLYGGQNNPSCTGYNPQPPGGYGYAAEQANGAYGYNFKIDGALTLQTPAQAAEQVRRTGNGVFYISPALAGTPLGQGYYAPVWRDGYYDDKPHPEDDPNSLVFHTDYVEGHVEFLYVPGNGAGVLANGPKYNPPTPGKGTPGGPIKIDPPPQGPNQGNCKGIAETIFDILNGYWSNLTWVKGLVLRVDQQANGSADPDDFNGPGSPTWTKHRNQIDGTRRNLKNALKAWDKNNCGPRPPAAQEWYDKSEDKEVQIEWNRRHPPKRISVPDAPVFVPIPPPIPWWQSIPRTFMPFIFIKIPCVHTPCDPNSAE